MTLDALIMLAGFFVAVLPFLGFPIQWDNIILVILGVAVIVLGIIVRRGGVAPKAGAPKKEETSPESAPHYEGEGQ